MNLLSTLTADARFVRQTNIRDTRRRTRAEDLDEPDWSNSTGSGPTFPAPREWRFCSFLLCMAITALPLICIRWTSTDPSVRAAMTEDALMLALPVALPLPFLLVACVAALAFHPASRTRQTCASFAAALAIGLAAACALAT